MSKEKKLTRQHFRDICLKRDNYSCKICRLKCPTNLLPEDFYDVHHITDRSEMPNGGYCKENGITLCPDCHLKAEQFHITGTAVVNYHPDDLYKLIGSSYEKALEMSKKIK